MKVLVERGRLTSIITKLVLVIMALIALVFVVNKDVYAHNERPRPTMCTQACQPTLGTCTIICH